MIREADEAQKEMVAMRLRQADAQEMLERKRTEKGLSVAALQVGSMNWEYSAISQGNWITRISPAWRSDSCN